MTLDSFLNILRSSELLEERALTKALADYRATNPSSEEAKGFAEFLCRKELLTLWQAGKLLQGKHRGYTLGRYRLLSLLGKGGMSSVYLAEHTVMKRRCAVKVLPTRKSRSASYLNRFHREARAVAALDHPNIVRAYDVDEARDGTLEIHFLVMEFVPGKTLFETVRIQGPLPVAKAVSFIRQAALGLEHAHQLGLIHRDVKPENLIVDKQGVLKVMDLGLARFFETDDENLTVQQDERVLGTANYCSPEQAVDSHDVDARTDIYSLGCTLYYTLMGHPPFSTGTLAQRLLAHQTKDPPAIEAKRPDVPREMIQIVRRMMAKSPEQRFQTMREAIDSLDAFMEGRKTLETSKVAKVGQPPRVDPPVATPPPAEAAKAEEAHEVVFPEFEQFLRPQADVDTANLAGDMSPTEPSPIELFLSQMSDSNAGSDSTVLPTESASRSDSNLGEPSSVLSRSASSPTRSRKSPKMQWRTILAVGLIVAAAGASLFLWLVFQAPMRPTLTGNETELHVGPRGHFGTVTEALDAIVKTAKQVRTIRVAEDYDRRENIVLNGKGSQSIPKGLRLVGDGKSQPILRGESPESAVLQLHDVEGLTVEKLTIDAGAGDVAIQVSGFLIDTHLADLSIGGFKGAGIDAQGLNGFPGQECLMESLVFQSALPGAVGIRLRAAPAARTSELKIEQVRFYAPLTNCVEIIGDAWHVSIEKCIFHSALAGLRFSQSNQDLQDVSITHNTFSSCKHGLVFAGQPADGSEITLSKNLFVRQKDVEALVETGLTPELAARLAPANDRFQFNWSDRKAPETPVAGELDIFGFKGRRGIPMPKFASPSSESADFLKPVGEEVNVQSESGSADFVGAVAPSAE